MTPTSSSSSKATTQQQQLPKKTATTPVRNNNYAAPHTPIASVKRPRSSMLSPGAGAKGASTFDSSNPNLPPSSASKATPRGGCPAPLPMTPLDSASGANTPAPKTPTANMIEEGNEEIETAALMSPIHGVSKGQVTSWASDSFAELNHNSASSYLTAGNNSQSEISASKMVMSPMHPPKPVQRTADHKISVAGAAEAAAALDLETSNSSDGTSSWVGRQVDALFSPVLNLFHGEDGEEGQDGEPVEDSAEVATPVKQPDSAKTADANSNATVPTTTSDEDDVLHTPEEEYATGDPIDHNQVVEDEDVDDSEHHQHHQHHQDDDEEYSEEDEDEFNPYVFIKSLPAYDLVSHNRPPIALPPKKADSPPISLVLDLDETLVHCTVEPVDDADLVFPVVFHGMTYQVHVRLRPHLFTFLERIQDKYEVIVFTASQKVYANELLNLIDPEGKYIHYRMFRESCLSVEGNFLKDLTVLGRDLSQAVLVDNSPHAFGYQVDNGIPIESWFDDPNDTELLKLERFLRTLEGARDVRTVVRNKFQTHRLVREA